MIVFLSLLFDRHWSYSMYTSHNKSSPSNYRSWGAEASYIYADSVMILFCLQKVQFTQTKQGMMYTSCSTWWYIYKQFPFKIKGLFFDTNGRQTSLILFKYFCSWHANPTSSRFIATTTSLFPLRVIIYICKCLFLFYIPFINIFVYLFYTFTHTHKLTILPNLLSQ